MTGPRVCPGRPLSVYDATSESGVEQWTADVRSLRQRCDVLRAKQQRLRTDLGELTAALASAERKLKNLTKNAPNTWILLLDDDA